MSTRTCHPEMLMLLLCGMLHAIYFAIMQRCIADSLRSLFAVNALGVETPGGMEARVANSVTIIRATLFSWYKTRHPRVDTQIQELTPHMLRTDAKRTLCLQGAETNGLSCIGRGYAATVRCDAALESAPCVGRGGRLVEGVIADGARI